MRLANVADAGGGRLLFGAETALFRAGARCRLALRPLRVRVRESLRRLLRSGPEAAADRCRLTRGRLTSL
jgi:hypothetical protein